MEGARGVTWRAKTTGADQAEQRERVRASHLDVSLDLDVTLALEAEIGVLVLGLVVGYALAGSLKEVEDLRSRRQGVGEEERRGDEQQGGTLGRALRAIVVA